MKSFIKSKKGLVLLATLVVAAAAAIGAYAYFSSTGHGSGSASVGSSTAFTFTTGNETGAMYPGGDSSTWATEDYTVNNPSTGAQKLHQVVVSIAGTDLSGNPTTFDITGTGGNADCTASDFELSVDGGTTWSAAGASATDTGIAADISAGGTSTTDTVTIRMIDTNANQDACQGATVPLYYSAS
jgi:hypothetical protein